MTGPSTSVGMLRRLLGTQLARLREAAGLRQDDAAARLGKATSKVSRAESGAVGLNQTDLELLLDLYAASPRDRAWCRDLQERSKVRRGRPSGETTLYLGPRWFRAFRDLEMGAVEVMMVGSEIVPGILQAESYTRAMFVAQGLPADDRTVEDTIRVRAERQRALIEGTGPRYSVVLSESSLRRRIGDDRVMADQMRHLLELAELPRVTLQVYPFDSLSYQPMGYKFTILRFSRDMGEDIAYIEMYDSAAYLDKPSDNVPMYADLFHRLQSVALGPIESRNFVGELADQFAAKLGQEGDGP